MNARVEVAWLEVPTRHRATWVVHPVTQQLVAAIDALSVYSLRVTDPTLEDLRLALQGTGFTWSKTGGLVFSSERAAVIDELDRLIGVFGRDMSAAYPFPGLVEIPAVLGEAEALTS